MGPFEATSIAVLTLLLVLGVFQQSADTRAAPVECSAAVQDAEGTLSGTVSDTSGAGISGASITASGDLFHRTVTTDSTGAYSLRLPTGKYYVRVTAKNFTPAERDIVVSAGNPVVEWKPTLTLAPVKATVLVDTPGYAVIHTTAGSKMDASLLDVPQSITVVDHKLLSDQGVEKLDDAVKNVAGVMPGGYYEAWDFYRLRGFAASFNTYIDGLRGGNGMGEETFGLESVEVLKGPSSTLYGQSVPGGIVNLRSKLPHPDTFAYIQFAGGSYGFYEPAIDAGASLNRSHTLYARLNLLYRQTHSFTDYVSRHRVYVAPALTWNINPNTQLTFLGRYQHDTDHLAFPLPARGTVLPNPNGEISISRFVGEPSNPNPVAEHNYHFGYQLSHRFNDAISLYQNFRVSWYQNHWDKLLYPSFLGADQRTLFRYPLSWREEWSNYVADTGLLVHAKSGRVQHDIVGGLEYYREPRKYSSESIDFGDPSAYMPIDVFNPIYGTPFSTLRPFISGHTRTRYIGLYIQDRLQLTNRLSLTAGGRLDFISDRDFSLRDSNDNHAFSPRLGATYRLASGVARQELSMPQSISLAEMKGFGLFMLKAVLSGRGDEIIELAKVNLFR
jgi:iron complex outermembrane recepter protein